MRTFHVPQFIEVEDKIFGPLTLKQFIYLLGGGATVFILWVFLPAWLAIVIAIPIILFVLALSFYKVNSQPFMKVLGNAVSYSSRGRLYVWKKRGRKKKFEKVKGKTAKPMFELPKLGEGKLKDLAWSLDIKEEVKR